MHPWSAIRGALAWRLRFSRNSRTPGCGCVGRMRCDWSTAISRNLRRGVRDGRNYFLLVQGLVLVLMLLLLSLFALSPLLSALLPALYQVGGSNGGGWGIFFIVRVRVHAFGFGQVVDQIELAL